MEVLYGEIVWDLLVVYTFFDDDDSRSRLCYSRGSSHLSHLHYMRRFQLCFHVSTDPSFDIKSFCEQLRIKVDGMCAMLLELPVLHSVEISWFDDTTEEGAWEEKARILEPLKLLPPACLIQLGELDARFSLENCWTGASRKVLIEYLDSAVSGRLQCFPE